MRPGTRKRKPMPSAPRNAWFIIAPDRSPLSIGQPELAKMFKKWMLRFHPDKGGDEQVAAELSALFSHAMGRNLSELGEAPSKS